MFPTESILNVNNQGCIYAYPLIEDNLRVTIGHQEMNVLRIEMDK